VQRYRMTCRALCVGLFFAGLIPVSTASAGGEDRPLPGGGLELRRTVDQAEVVAVGRGFRQLMGGGTGDLMVCTADIDIEDCLKGDLPPGRLRIGVTARHPESIPPDGRGKDRGYLLFITRRKSKGRQDYHVIKMLPATEANVRSVRELRPKR